MSDPYPLLPDTVLSDVIEYYDRPVLFTARHYSIEGQSYLHMLADSTADYDIWLVAPMTEETFLSLRSAEITLREVFSDPDLTSHVYEIDTRYNSTKLLNVSDIPDDMLSEEGETVEF